MSTSRHGRFSFLAVTVLILVLSLTLASCGSITSSPNSYSVTYDGNGNTGGSAPIDLNKYVNGQTVTVLGNTDNLVKTGYAFVGWNTLTDGSGATYTQAQTFTMVAANVTLYAIWTTNPTYTVTYDGNGNTGGSVPVDYTNYMIGQTVTVLGNTGNLVKNSYFFVGWNTQADGSGASYPQAQTFAMGVANVTLYAMWTANPTYTVTYIGNGSSGGSVPVDFTNYEQGQTVTVLGNPGTLVRTNYSFVGWNMQANGSGTTYTQAQTFTIGVENVTLYAMWTANPTYTVTYNGNGSTSGSVPIDSTNYEQGQTVSVLGNAGSLVKTNYFFGGWNTHANGTGTTYTQSQTFTMGAANVTLYAMWTANPTYTVTYNGNVNTGGIVPVDSTNYQQLQTVTVLGNTGNLVKTGYAFVGWNTLANGSGATYKQSNTFTMGAANVTLYAMWTPTYTVTYIGNGSTGGSAPIDPTNYQIGQTVTVLDNTGNLVKLGYTFAGWNTQANGAGTTYAPAATFAMGAANVTLYAMWTANNYTVTYNGNGSTGGSAPIDPTNYQIGQTVTVLGTGTLVKTGYTFAGWNTQSNGAGTTYAPAATFAMGAANVTLHAMWTANNYTVTYNGNGSTGGSAPIDPTNYHIGLSVTVLGTGTLVRTNYTFAGWNTQANGAGTTYAPAATFAMGAANVTLYAMWTANPTFTVTYNGNGSTSGSAPSDPTNYQIGQLVTVLGTGTLVRTNYTFAGWNTQANGAGTTYAPAATFAMGAANVTLYAMWTANPTFTVTYNGNGSTSGSAPSDPTNYQIGQLVTVLGIGTLVRTNYTFAGWNTQANGAGTTYAPAATFAMGAANVTLHAMWTVNPTFTVTYNSNGSTGGSAPSDPTNYQIGQLVTVLGIGTLVRTNYTFAGWNTQANGAGTTYTQSQTFTMGSTNVTLYAMWTANPTFTVTYAGNGADGGIVPIDSANYEQGATVTVSGNTGNLVKTGFTFAGWNTQADGLGATYGATFTMGAANVTLYAMWN